MSINILGKPITILKFDENKKIIDDSKLLRELFLHEKVKDRKIVIFSVTGSFRRGKSFFLDYCLRYLYANYDSLNRENGDFQKKPNWMGKENDKLCGFSWRSGAERDTTGIIFWSDVFFHTNQQNVKFAIFVVDTQGLFDNETTPMENSKIFALSTLMSSIHVINLNGIIREDELDYFQFAMEFAKMAHEDDKRKKAFEKLVFLVRDWQNEENYEYGSIGGAKYLQHVMKLKENHKELNSVRQFLLKSFDNIQCHLLPHPGKNVAGKKDYSGQWSLMDQDFRVEMFQSIEKLLNPVNLIAKRINGREVDAEYFYVHLQNFFKFFSSDDLPKVATMYELLVETDLNFLIEKYFKIYKQNMDECEDEIEHFSQIGKFFEINKEEAMFDFKCEQKLGSDESIEKAVNKLNEKIDEHFRYWEKTQKQLISERYKANILKKSLSDHQTKNESLSKEIIKVSDELKTVTEKSEKEKQEQRKKLEKSLTEHKEETAKLRNIISDQKAQIDGLEVLSRSRSSTSTPIRSDFSLDSLFLYQPSYSRGSSPFSSASSSSSSRAVNPWNSFQTSYSSVWRGMSAAEKQSAGGNFQTAASRAYRSGK